MIVVLFLGNGTSGPPFRVGPLHYYIDRFCPAQVKISEFLHIFLIFLNLVRSPTALGVQAPDLALPGAEPLPRVSWLELRSALFAFHNSAPGVTAYPST